MSHADFIVWAAEGHKDAMGHRFSDWRVARYQQDGRVMRDARNRVVYETQSEWLARHGTQSNQMYTPVQQALFS